MRVLEGGRRVCDNDGKVDWARALMGRASCQMQALSQWGRPHHTTPNNTEATGVVRELHLKHETWTLRTPVPMEILFMYIVLHFPVGQKRETENLKCIALFRIKTRNFEPV